MKKRFLAVFFALALCVGLMPPLIQEVSAKEPQYEQAWYPAAHMYIVQIAYESGVTTEKDGTKTKASHKDKNTFDIANVSNLSAADKRIFAPFTGTIVYIDKSSNFVVLQSNNKVRYADGTVDYMSVGFMHDDDIDNKNVPKLTRGKVIKQGDPFYDAGNKGNSNGNHVQITVFKGRLYDEKNGYKQLHNFKKDAWYSCGTVDPYNAFFVNTSKTKAYKHTEVGYLYPGHTVSKKGALSNWIGQWKDLNGNPFPKLPTISGAKSPSTLKVGEKFSISGKISSDTKIISVTAGVYDAEKGGNIVAGVGTTVTPSTPHQLPKGTVRTTTYQIGDLASKVQFNKLPAGTYWYRVTAQNGGGTATLVNKKFTVGNAATLPTISGANAPDTLQTGDSFSVQGTISSNAKITSVTAGVYTAESGGTARISKTVNPNDTSYSLSKLASSIQFSNLPAGTYWYRVTAKNSAGTATLINKKFTVKNPSVQAAPKAAILTPGWYTLAPACAPNMRLDVAYGGASSEDPVWTWEANGTNAQAWYLLPYSMTVGHYHLVAGTNRETEMVLDVQYGGTTSGTEVWLYEANGTLAQEWIFLDAGGGYYYIVPCENQNLTLAVRGGSSDEGSGIIVETRNGSLGQKWKLTKY